MESADRPSAGSGNDAAIRDASQHRPPPIPPTSERCLALRRTRTRYRNPAARYARQTSTPKSHIPANQPNSWKACPGRFRGIRIHRLNRCRGRRTHPIRVQSQEIRWRSSQRKARPYLRHIHSLHVACRVGETPRAVHPDPRRAWRGSVSFPGRLVQRRRLGTHSAGSTAQLIKGGHNANPNSKQHACRRCPPEKKLATADWCPPSQGAAARRPQEVQLLWNVKTTKNAI